MLTDTFSVDPKKYFGRPETARLPEEEACYDLLQRLQIPFARADHDPAMTIELCHEVEKILGAKICKNLFLTNRQGTAFYLLLMPGDKPFKTKFLSAQLDCARLSFAGEAALWELMKLRPGSATVFGLLQESAGTVQLVIDKALLEEPYFACHPCYNTSTVSFSTEDLIHKLLPAMGFTPTLVELPEVCDG